MLTPDQPLVSICVSNYNYGAYVGRAVRSALGQTYPRVEVIVVDDGSTDDSLSRLAELGGGFTLITQPNQGQARAMNGGYEASHGDYVIFLDSDDFLEPDCVEAVVAVARPDLGKVHWRLRLVDQDEHPIGFNPSDRGYLASGHVADELVATGSYASVPTSGNCYPRAALQQFMPIPEDDFKLAGDGYLNLAAPLVGPLVAVDRPLTSYRIHDRNRSTSRGRLDPVRLQIRLDQAEVQDAWLQRLARRSGRTAAPGTVVGHPEFRLMRLLAGQVAAPRRLAAGQIRAGLALTARAARTPGLSPRRRLLLAGSGLAVPLLPDSWVEHVRDVAFGAKPLRSWPGRAVQA